MNPTISGSLRHAAVYVCLLLSSMLAQNAGAKPSDPPPPKPTLNTPTLSFSNPSQTTIDVTVTAGATGAPYGFTLQWMTQADYLANGFSSTAPFGCAASFAGEASGSRYPLGPNGSVTVTVGNFLHDPGFGTDDQNCQKPLVCGTVYVFRVFAHGGQDWMRSDFSTIYIAPSTLACSTGCTLTQGYWKTHGPIPVGNNVNTWPVTTLTLGSAPPYSALQLLAILNQKPMGNGLIILAHQLIAVRLSIANGADATPIAGAIAAADLLIGGLVVPPVGSGWLDPSLTDGVTGTLDDWLNANDCSNPTPQ